MRIGEIAIDPPVMLAPMAGVSNRAFRALARDQGASLCITEMVSANAMMHHSAKSDWLMELDPGERPVGIQIAGSDPEVMALAAVEAAAHGADLIDINMGCPVAKVVKNGDGSALLTDPDQAVRVAKAVVDAVRLPVTVKVRAGWDANSITAPDLAEGLEAVGVKAITVHARTRSDQYLRAANWDYIRQVKARTSMPVIGNGDVKSPEDALKMMETTGCDGVMVGRASFGDPWIFRRIAYFWKYGAELPPPEADERAAMAKRHLERMVAIKGEAVAIPEMRKQLAWYLKDLPGSSQYRARCNQLHTSAEAVALIEEWFSHATRFSPAWN